MSGIDDIQVVIKEFAIAEANEGFNSSLKTMWTVTLSNAIIKIEDHNLERDNRLKAMKDEIVLYLHEWDEDSTPFHQIGSQALDLLQRIEKALGEITYAG